MFHSFRGKTLQEAKHALGQIDGKTGRIVKTELTAECKFIAFYYSLFLLCNMITFVGYKKLIFIIKQNKIAYRVLHAFSQINQIRLSAIKIAFNDPILSRTQIQTGITYRIYIEVLFFTLSAPIYRR